MTSPSIVYLQHLAGEARSRIPVSHPPTHVFVARPQRVARDVFGALAHVIPSAGGTPNPGHGQVLAWLCRIGSDQPDYAEVQFDTGETNRHVPVDWLHMPQRVVDLRPRGRAPFRRTA